MKIRFIVAAILASALGAASATAQATWTTDGVWGAEGFARAADFNNDGRTDIASPSGAIVYMKRSTGSGFLNEVWEVDSGSTQWGAAINLLAGDFNCDGNADFAQTGSANAVIVKKNLLSGSARFVTQSYVSAGPWGAEGFRFAGDFDGDGCKDDIVSFESNFAYYRQGVASPIFNMVYGFSGAQTFTVNATWGSSAWTFAADFNCDGRDDVASASGSAIYMKFSPFSTTSSATWTVSGTWGAAGFARAGRFGGGFCSDNFPNRIEAGIASPVSGPTVNVKVNNNPTPSFSESVWTTNNSWGNAAWTFVGNFRGSPFIGSELASANGANVYMKF